MLWSRGGVRGLIEQLAVERHKVHEAGFGVLLSAQAVDSNYLERDAEAYKHELDLKKHERTMITSYFLDGKILEAFSLPPAKLLLLYAPVLVFWNEIDSSRLTHMVSLLCWQTKAVRCLVNMIAIHSVFIEWWP